MISRTRSSGGFYYVIRQFSTSSLAGPGGGQWRLRATLVVIVRIFTSSDLACCISSYFTVLADSTHSSILCLLGKCFSPVRSPRLWYKSNLLQIFRSRQPRLTEPGICSDSRLVCDPGPILIIPVLLRWSNEWSFV